MVCDEGIAHRGRNENAKYGDKRTCETWRRVMRRQEASSSTAQAGHSLLHSQWVRPSFSLQMG